MQTAINLYSVRELSEPTLDILDRVAAAGYDGVQFSGGLGDATPEDVRDALDDHGLEPTPPHVGIETIEDELDSVVETYGDVLECSGVVVPGIFSDEFETAERVDGAADRMASLADDLESEGLGLHYHNHAHEFTDLGEETAFGRFARGAPAVNLELDVGWARTGGQDPAALLEQYAGRVPLVHMKDMTADEDFAELGEGIVDLEACTAAAEEAGTEWLIYEHDDPADPATSIDTGASVLDSLLGR